MARIRVVIAEVPGMLGDIIRRLLDAEVDIEIVGEVARGEDAPSLMRHTHTDVVILGLDDSTLPALANELFTGDPLVRLLGVAGDGRHAFLYELRPHRVPLGEVSPDELVRAIRERVGSSPLAER